MRRLGFFLLAAFVTACSSPAPETMVPATTTPNVQTREVTYDQGSTPLKGMMAWDANITTPRPGVLVVHEWWGLDEHARNQAKRLAEAGYVAFALDVYGDGKMAQHPDEAQKFMTEASADPATLAARVAAARDVLTADPHVKADDIGIIGYCFGGAVALNAARAGGDYDAVVSFHGILATETPAKAGMIKGRILVAAGDADEFVPAAQVQAFRDEMAAAGVDAKVVVYPGAKHAFTNPKAAEHGMSQLGYDANADQQSWKEMLSLFSQVWGTK